jgi:prevent-host-death family protein
VQSQKTGTCFDYTFATIVVSLTEAKAQMSELIERAARGEEIVIRRDGVRVARLIGYAEPSGRRISGDLRGQIWMSDDFDKPDEEIERLFGTRD